MIAVRITYTGMIMPSLVQISGNIPMNPIKFTPISLSTSIVGTRPVAHHHAAYFTSCCAIACTCSQVVHKQQNARSQNIQQLVPLLSQQWSRQFMQQSIDADGDATKHTPLLSKASFAS